MNADGTGVTRIIKLEGMQARPCWSPDGKRLAFTWNRDGNYDIYTINLDGSGLMRVTDDPERDDYAAWHPDGKSIAFRRRTQRQVRHLQRAGMTNHFNVVRTLRVQIRHAERDDYTANHFHATA